MSKKEENGAAKGKEKENRVTIPPPNMKIGEFHIRGTSPLVQHAWSIKIYKKMKEKQEKGESGKNQRKREPKDFMECYEEAKHISTDGWAGIPATAFRNALISACRVSGYVMSRAKLSLFVLADGFDRKDAMPLVKITKGKARYFETTARLDSGNPDVRVRPMFDPGWEANVRVRWDDDQFKVHDVANLLMRAGVQVGIQEGRPDSKKSCGVGWGCFELVNGEEDPQ